MHVPTGGRTPLSPETPVTFALGQYTSRSRSKWQNAHGSLCRSLAAWLVNFCSLLAAAFQVIAGQACNAFAEIQKGLLGVRRHLLDYLARDFS